MWECGGVSRKSVKIWKPSMSLAGSVLLPHMAGGSLTEFVHRVGMRMEDLKCLMPLFWPSEEAFMGRILG